MDDIAAGIVDDAENCKETTAPDGVCDDTVGERQPERYVNDPGEKVHPS